MRKVILTAGVLAVLLVSCEKDSSESQNNATDAQEQEVVVDMSDFSLYVESDDLTGKSSGAVEKCVSMKNLEYRLGKNKGLAKKMYDIEYTTRKAIALKANGKGKPGGGGGGGGTPPPIYEGAITIPVVINIIEKFPGEVTQSQITSQIRILNEDFNNNNSNTSGVPSAFAGLVADVDITFVAGTINRVVNTRNSWGTNDAMKDPSQGGIAPTDPANNLNIWVCEIGGGILGYAQFPGGAAATDGVVIGTDFFGENSAGGIYGKGRTGTHEVGHWLNLRHIWGDGRCNRDDFVADTPKSDRANYNCPTYPTTHCRSADMTMNYMDYVQDDCMYMFTLGQNERMRALFVAGGPREGFVN
ncbi:zinc metalloprotease [Flavobacteriaceae bacterium TP-CH-4]|uniref:Zinc metalloprotease n=1 Tax=Pelagihabitans pacificus TaxID=2696054 RepID=A0A967E760_9FLAO|nr:zinc metalloprotease [Pelagihabitans pacificus]NHF60330.1 zinc metalloprotease [Pelagihabitans pacificus]